MRIMGVVVALLSLSYGGCKGEPEGYDPDAGNPPPRPPDGPPADAAVTPDAQQLAGKVCVLSDMRDRSKCGSPAVDTLTIRLERGSTVIAMAMNGSNGLFLIDLPAPPFVDVFWVVSGASHVTALMPFESNVSPQIPIMPAALYSTLVEAHGGPPTSTQGAVVAWLLGASKMPMPDATAAVIGGGALATYYDTADPAVWSQTSTGAFGVAWSPNNNQGVRSINVSKTKTKNYPGIQVRGLSITFLTLFTE